MTRWESYRLLGQLLARCCGKAQPDLDLTTADWPALIEASSHHLATPALAWSVADNNATPPDVREYLQAVLVLNARRNEMLLDVLESIVHALNGLGIMPVLLKGAAALAEPLYAHVGARTLGDLDLLIPRERSDDALACIRRVGFADANVMIFVEGETQHLPTHVHADKGVGLDLHVSVVAPPFAPLVPTDAFVANATPCAFRGLSALMPSPTDRVAHNIVHSQIVDGLHLRGIVSPRQLLDLAMLSARHQDAIRWAELGARFHAAGYAFVFRDTVAIAQFLFSQPDVLDAGVAGSRAIARLRRAIERPGRQRWGSAALLARRFLHGLRATPRLRLNLFQPRTWPRRAESIRKALRRPKW